MKRFYINNPGLLVRRVVGNSLSKQVTPHVTQTIVGIGYANPFLRPWVDKARRVISFTPGPQGVISWPYADKISTSLIEETHVPLPDSSVDILVLAHVLEHTKDPALLMEECHRILAATGKIVIIAPNRRGIWAQLERTPFGYGRPFSAFQLEQLLTSSGFKVDSITANLFTPPVKNKAILRISDGLEKLGKLPWPLVGGVLISSAHKEVFAPIKGPRKRVPALVWNPQAVGSYRLKKNKHEKNCTGLHKD